MFRPVHHLATAILGFGCLGPDPAEDSGRDTDAAVYIELACDTEADADKMKTEPGTVQGGGGLLVATIIAVGTTDIHNGELVASLRVDMAHADVVEETYAVTDVAGRFEKSLVAGEWDISLSREAAGQVCSREVTIPMQEGATSTLCLDMGCVSG